MEEHTFEARLPYINANVVRNRKYPYAMHAMCMTTLTQLFAREGKLGHLKPTLTQLFARACPKFHFEKRRNP